MRKGIGGNRYYVIQFLSSRIADKLSETFETLSAIRHNRTSDCKILSIEIPQNSNNQ